MEEDKIITIDRLTFSAVSEVIENCSDDKYLSNPGGFEDLLPAFKKLQIKYPYLPIKEIIHIDRADMDVIAKGLEYMVNTKDDWDILQISKSDGQALIGLLKSNVDEVKLDDWLTKLM